MKNVSQSSSANRSTLPLKSFGRPASLRRAVVNGTSQEARHRLEKFGPNATPDTTAQPLLRALSKFWAPVPWILEAAIVLRVVLGDYPEAAIIAGFLVFNAALGLVQESRAQAILAALKSRLALSAAVPARRSVENRAGCRTGARRCREAFTRCRGSGGCA
jgi:magnesium-transporting ATPase (P-type)